MEIKVKLKPPIWQDGIQTVGISVLDLSVYEAQNILNKATMKQI